MSDSNGIFIGTDSGATTSKTGGIRADGSVISTKLMQSSTNSQSGTQAVINGWIQGVQGFLQANGLNWQQVRGVGLALPGPYLSYGVLGKSANLPAAFSGWHFFDEYKAALEKAAGRPVDLVTGNDGRLGGVAEADRVRGQSQASVLMLAPGSGLGGAYINKDGLPLDGDTFCGTEIAHTPAPLQLLGLPPFKCGCGREWGCIEAYTTISGLPQMIEHLLPRYPGHELATSTLTPKEKALSLRGRAQKGDALSLEIFDIQAKALGYLIASLAMILDPTYVVIGGGLMDPESTSEEFRKGYLGRVRDTAMPYLWTSQRERMQIVPASLGELSQAIGAALIAKYAYGKSV